MSAQRANVCEVSFNQPYLATMKELLFITEGFRRAEINTMYRASLCIAVVSKPGITTTQLAALLQTTREAVHVAVRALTLVYTEKLVDKTNRSKETKVYPTPYLKDIVANIKEKH